MKTIIVTSIAMILLTGIAHAASKTVTCEGTLEHGSGGNHVGKCWLGEGGDIDTIVSTVCKKSEHCKLTGKSVACEKDPDPNTCADIVKLYSVRR